MAIVLFLSYPATFFFFFFFPSPFLEMRNLRLERYVLAYSTWPVPEPWAQDQILSLCLILLILHPAAVLIILPAIWNINTNLHETLKKNVAVTLS